MSETQQKFTHVDDWIDTPSFPEDESRGERYAKWWLMRFRRPAWMRHAFDEFEVSNKGAVLFCTYEGKRWRCIGASRLGDVWLTSDFTKDHGYELRIYADGCSNWSDRP